MWSREVCMVGRLAELEPFARRFMLEQGRGRLRSARVLGARVGHRQLHGHETTFRVEAGVFD
jgi:hypothetical protein